MAEKFLNLLLPDRLQHLRLFHIFSIIAAVMVGIFAWEAYPFAVVAAFTGAIVFLFMHRLDWGLWLVALFAFFHEWQIDFSLYARFRDVPYLPMINAPAVDLLVILLAIAFGCSVLLGLYKFQKEQYVRIKPGILWYGLFLGAAICSVAWFMEYHFYSYGIKYLLRPMLFPWLMFWLLPVLIVRDKKTFSRISKLWYGVGIAIAVYGLASLVVLPQSGWIRVLPFALNGFAPLGYNHNQIAEVMVALIPMGAFLYARAKQGIERYAYGAGTMLMIVVALLTLSRAAWIALAAEVIALIVVFAKHKKRTVTIPTLNPVWIIVMPILLYMGVFLTSSIVSSSTSARLDAIKVAAFYIAESPLFGHGPGSFQLILQDTLLYTMEYGEPLDAHGFMHKILLEIGLFGFIFFVGFIIWVLQFVWNTQYISRHKEVSVALFAMALGAVVFQLFNTSYFNSVMWMPLGIATAGALIARQET